MKKLTIITLGFALVFAFYSIVLARGAGIEWEILNEGAVNLYRAGHHFRAVVVAEEALKVAEENVGKNHLDVASTLNNLAFLYKTMGNYAKAEALYIRSLEIYEKTLGPEHLSVTTILNNLAGLYREQGNNTKVELLFIRSLEISKKALGPEHPDSATYLYNLFNFYKDQGNYAKAEPLYKGLLGMNRHQMNFVNYIIFNPIIIVGSAAALLALAALIFHRQYSWSNLYFDRWHELEKIVLANYGLLFPMWCSSSLYNKYFIDINPVEGAATAIELIFAEMYFDFVVEIGRRNFFLNLLSGGFPGEIWITNPRMLHLWKIFLRGQYTKKEIIIIEKIIKESKNNTKNDPSGHRVTPFSES